MRSVLEAVKGRRAWIISDGKIGNDVQSHGVAGAMGLVIEVKPVAPRGVYKATSPFGPVDPRERFGTSHSQFCPPWPDFAFAIGRLTTPYIRALKRHAGLATYTVILQDPKTSARTADLYWVPEHDKRRGPNVITTLTAPHGFTAARLGELVRQPLQPALEALPRPRVAVLLGGPNGDYRYDDASLARLGAALRSLAALGAGLMVTPSRRTPAFVTEAVVTALTGTGAYVWNGAGENPYPQFLAHADAFVVPADSVNMTGEPCATGRPVYVFEPEGGSAKFTRFHAALRRLGATRPMPERFETLEAWSYPPVSAADEIALRIAERWSRRHAMIGRPAQRT